VLARRRFAMHTQLELKPKLSSGKGKKDDRGEAKWAGKERRGEENMT